MFKKSCSVLLLLYIGLLEPTWGALADANGIKIASGENGILSVQMNMTSGKYKLLVAKDGARYYYDLHPGGLEQFPLQMGSGQYQIAVMENVSGDQYSFVKNQTVSSNIEEDTAIFLNSVQNINWDEGSEAVKMAAQLTRGAATDSEKINIIYSYVIENISFDKAGLGTLPSDYVPDIDQTLQSKKGICYDFSSLFAAMARSVGVPCKLVKGYSDNAVGYHAWNEVYLDGTWKIIDTSVDAQVPGTMFKKSSNYKKVYEY
ncbi:MAG: transglutaminase-like domain-containing protein [Syntrophomonas sp.]